MVLELDDRLVNFSPVNRTRCFTHILNLVSKSLLKQFDIKREDKQNDDLDDDEKSLLALAENIEEEELSMAKENDEEDGEMGEDDDLNGWVNEVAALTPRERDDLERSIRPIKRMLVKVCWQLYTRLYILIPSSQLRKLAFRVVHSTTILLPAWKACLENLGLAVKVMPRDVSTRWNSTYDMLCFAIEYCAAIKIITAERKNDLRQFELTEEEWAVAKELREILEVRDRDALRCVMADKQTWKTVTLFRRVATVGVEGCNTLFLARQP